MIQLDDHDREWIKRKWALIRESQQKADRANRDWNNINNSINDYLDRKGETDIVQRAKIKGDSIPLKDALSTGTWHARNAERHIHDVNLFLKMKELGVL